MALKVVMVYQKTSVLRILNKQAFKSRFHNLTSSREQGFTLLELLIVIVIVSILFTFAVLSIRTPSPEDRIKEETLRLQRLIQLALEEAVMKNQEYGLEFKQDGYRFLTLTDNQWAPFDGDKLFRQRELPDEMEIELSVEQTDIIIGEAAETAETDDEEMDDEEMEKEKPKPQVFLLSSEEITPEFSARFTLRGVETSYILSGTSDGRQKIEASDL